MRYAAMKLAASDVTHDLAIEQERLMEIVAFMHPNSEPISKQLTEMVLLLATPPAPFTNSRINLTDFTLKTLVHVDETDGVEMKIAC
jgi:hypothetical protein